MEFYAVAKKIKIMIVFLLWVLQIELLCVCICYLCGALNNSYQL